MEWSEIIDLERQKPYFIALKEAVDERYARGAVYPPRNAIFNAFAKCPFEQTNIIILGQDPYHGEGQAMGLCFSTPSSIQNPPSMVNIFKEIEQDLGHPSQCLNGDLTPWAEQGVLLLNTILTVDAGRAKSHHNLGWEVFTDTIISTLSTQKEGLIFLLWGSNAIAKTRLIDTQKHHILTAPHPSPLSAYRGFFGSRHFSQCNAILQNSNRKVIQW